VSLRRQFIGALVTFVVLLTVAGGYLAWREARQALEAEMDLRASWVAGAAAATGLQASSVVGLRPGFEDTQGWTSTHAKLVALQYYVRAAYILREDNTALVTSFPADSIPIGAPLPEFDLYADELEEAREIGFATTEWFLGVDGQGYKWGFAELEDSRIVLAVLMPVNYQLPLDRLRRDLVVGSVVAALLAALLAGLLASGVVEPLERLSRVALRIQRGHLEERVDEEPGREVGRLSLAMERMRLGILERDESLRLMLAQVAHEIRNPLGGVELFAAAAAETDDSEERARLIRRVRTEVATLNTIIGDFLAFARPLERVREASDMRGPIGEAVELVQAEMDGGEGTLEVSLPDEAMMARVPADHVKRAVLNLLRNAAQAADHVSLYAALEHGEWVIAVCDDGPGVSETLRDRVFDPFVTDKEQGAGLGLAIVKKIAEAQGGRVELRNGPETNGGRGAEFRIYFGSLEDPPRPDEDE
jgi:signal transduction histidine kinase